VETHLHVLPGSNYKPFSILSEELLLKEIGNENQGGVIRYGLEAFHTTLWRANKPDPMMITPEILMIHRNLSG